MMKQGTGKLQVGLPLALSFKGLTAVMPEFCGYLQEGYVQ
jgi:hypothetical protein